MSENESLPDDFWDNAEESPELPPFVTKDEKADLAESGRQFDVTNIREGVNGFNKDSWYLDVMFSDIGEPEFRTISLEKGNYQRDHIIKQIADYIEKNESTVRVKLEKIKRAYYIARP